MESYFDGEKNILFEGKLIASNAGHIGGVSFDVAYKTKDGFLVGTRHKDRGDLMTNVRTLKSVPKNIKKI